MSHPHPHGLEHHGEEHAHLPHAGNAKHRPDHSAGVSQIHERLKQIHAPTRIPVREVARTLPLEDDTATEHSPVGPKDEAPTEPLTPKKIPSHDHEASIVRADHEREEIHKLEPKKTNKAFVAVDEQRIAQTITRTGATDDLRENERVLALTPRARAERLVLARVEASDRLSALETEAHGSFFASIRTSVERAQQRMRIQIYTRQIERIYSEHPEVYRDLAKGRVVDDRDDVHTLSDKETEQQLYRFEVLNHAETVAAKAARPDREKISAIHIDKVLLLTPAQRTIQAAGVSESVGNEFLLRAHRVAHLQEVIRTTQPTFMQRLLRQDPAATQRNELTLERTRLQRLLEHYPQLVP